MGEVQEIDVEQIMDRIRENIRRRRGAAGDSPASENHLSPFDSGQAAADLAYLHSGYEIRNISFVSHRRVVGPLIVAAKKALRKLLTPILERQVLYNAASTRVTTHLKEWVATLDRQQAQAVQAVNTQMQALERSQAQLRDEVLDVQARLRAEVLALESRLRQELLATQSQLREDALATQSQLREDALAAQSQLRGDVLAAQSRLREEVAGQSRALQEVRQSSATARERVSGAERKLRRVLHALETGQARDGRPETRAGEERPALALPELEPEFDYAGFEERFRGSEEELKERQRSYVQYFEGRENILDIGCGRGEFLELLRESGIKARGVDLDLDMVLLCRDKGLDAVRDDAFAYLAALPDDSVGGVFAAQVIEHLPPRRVIELVTLCYRKLAPGGVLILETPNPKCLMVFADSFYKDPSHVQPLHPDTMQFLLEATGFHEVEVRFSAPVDSFMRIPLLQAPGADLERFNEGIERLNSLLFGFQDYAVIGRK